MRSFARFGHAGTLCAAALIVAASLGGCAGSQRVPFKAESAPSATLDAIEGDWAPTREGARVQELSIERDRGRLGG
jgi:hypothetical protein